MRRAGVLMERPNTPNTFGEDESQAGRAILELAGEDRENHPVDPALDDPHRDRLQVAATHLLTDEMDELAGVARLPNVNTNPRREADRVWLASRVGHGGRDNSGPHRAAHALMSGPTSLDRAADWTHRTCHQCWRRLDSSVFVVTCRGPGRQTETSGLVGRRRR